MVALKRLWRETAHESSGHLIQTYRENIQNKTTSPPKTFYLTYCQICHHRHTTNGCRHHATAPKRQELSPRHPWVIFTTDSLRHGQMTTSQGFRLPWQLSPTHHFISTDPPLNWFELSMKHTKWHRNVDYITLHVRLKKTKHMAGAVSQTIWYPCNILQRKSFNLIKATGSAPIIRLRCIAMDIGNDCFINPLG